MSNRKKVVIIVFNAIDTDVRVLRQVHTLKDAYDVTLISFGGNAIPDISMINIPRVRMNLLDKVLGLIFLLLRLYLPAYWRIYKYRKVSQQVVEHDLVIANDIETLPLAFKIRSLRTKVIFDAHEFAMRQFDNDLRWRILFKGFNRYLTMKFVPETDAMITQNRLFAEEFRKMLAVEPGIMTNAPERFDLQPRATKKEIRLIHHGIYNASRKIERLIEVVDLLPEHYKLYLMLHVPALSNDQSRARFDEFVNTASEHPRVEVLEAVKGHEVVPTIHAFDIGVHILEPINYNHAHSLPNKILEFIQARLAVVIGPSPGMVDIVDQYQVGRVAKDFSAQAIASTIQSMDRGDIDTCKSNSHIAADVLNSDKNKATLLSMVGDLLGQA